MKRHGSDEGSSYCRALKYTFVIDGESGRGTSCSGFDPDETQKISDSFRAAPKINKRANRFLLWEKMTVGLRRLLPSHKGVLNKNRILKFHPN